MTETGLFFGSFNPVHIGHLAIANYITEYSSLKEVWFVVSPHNPLKAKESLLGERDRFYMTELAIGDDPRFRVSDIEFTLPRPSYTIDTLAHLTEKYPSRRFTLIMGEDNLTTLHKWKNAGDACEAVSDCRISQALSGEAEQQEAAGDTGHGIDTGD